MLMKYIVIFTALVRRRRRKTERNFSFAENRICTYIAEILKTFTKYWRFCCQPLEVIVLKRGKTVWNWGIETQQEGAFRPHMVQSFGQTQVPPFYIYSTYSYIWPTYMACLSHIYGPVRFPNSQEGRGSWPHMVQPFGRTQVPPFCVTPSFVLFVTILNCLSKFKILQMIWRCCFGQLVSQSIKRENCWMKKIDKMVQ